MMKKSVAIVGGGPAALMLAAFLDPRLFSVTIYEQNKSLGRKFLVAGKGGFNLTHSEEINAFLARYTPKVFLEKTLLEFDNQALRTWLSEIEIPTFVGTSKRVYPVKGIKPIEVLNRILTVLEQNEVTINTMHQWCGWTEKGHLQFKEKPPVMADYVVFALGGASWKVTGSDGSWLDWFGQRGIATKIFKPANCAYEVNWPSSFLQKNEGQALKNIAIRCGAQIQKGEAVITQFGLEGNAIYALSPMIQPLLDKEGIAPVFIDLKPQLELAVIQDRIEASKEKNTAQTLKKALKLSPVKVALIKSQLSKADYQDPQQLAKGIKDLPLQVLAAAPIDQAISTTGGIDLSSINAHFELKQLPNHFCIGEMLDWNAPTGGYLLQACFSMGVALARHLNSFSV
jgi:hypothetical protein